MQGNRFLLTVSCIIFGMVGATDFNNLVETSSGRIKGKTLFYNGKSLSAFLGIPYAEPPVNKLRFKKTVPVKPWKTTLTADTLPPGCIQHQDNPFPFVDKLPGLTEDCLYLNVWTPTVLDSENLLKPLDILNVLHKNKKSVMFCIHGGGFQFGSSRVDYNNGEALAAEGDVIIVTINYRLGAEGFFYSGTEEAPGNMGMWDIIEALNWVRNNIEAFGGDKDSITLFGHSTGGVAIGMFCVSEITKGLFKRAILQSGVPTNMDGEDNHKSSNTSRRLAIAVGCASHKNHLHQNLKIDMDCMRSKNATMLAILLQDITVNQGDPRVYYPRVDNEFLTKNPREAIKDGDFNPVDILISSNNGDGSYYITEDHKDVFGFFGEKDPKINMTVGELIIRQQFKRDSTSNQDAVVEQYLGNVSETDYEKIRLQAFSASGDYHYICPTVYFAESFAKKKVTVRYYYYTHRSSNSQWAPWMLAARFEDMPYAFGYPLRYPENYTKKERDFSRRMIRMWTNFAKTGDPTVKSWPNYSKENPTYAELNADAIKPCEVPQLRNCDFFRPIFGF